MQSSSSDQPLALTTAMPAETSAEMPPVSSDRTASPRHVCTILVLLTPVLIAGWVRSAPPTETRTFPATRAAIDPNTAPWYELAALPGIGEVKAKAIVRYRMVAASDVVTEEIDRGTPAFRSPSDLARVRGIGPKTVARIGPYLWFEDR